MSAGDRTPAKLVSGSDEAGDTPGAFWYSEYKGDPHAHITHVCPRCHHFGGVAFYSPHGWRWDGNIDKPTVTGSILHDQGRCGWHGFLTAGEFIEI